MFERITHGAVPFLLLVLVPAVHLAIEGAHGAARMWRILCTFAAITGGIALTAAGGVGASLLSMVGLAIYFAAWRQAPPEARAPRLGAGDFELVGGPFPARVSMRGRGFERTLEYMTEMPAESPRLRIASDPWLGRQRPDPSMTVFDAPGWRHHIASDDVRRAVSILTPVLRSIVERCDAIHRGSFLLELRPGVLTIRAFAGGDEANRSTDWLNDCTALAEHLRDALRTGMPMRTGAVMTEPDPAGIEVVEVATRTARCQICGCAIGEAPVRCASCGTAHHAECWEYNGACSVYACGSLHAAGAVESMQNPYASGAPGSYTTQEPLDSPRRGQLSRGKICDAPGQEYTRVVLQLDDGVPTGHVAVGNAAILGRHDGLDFRPAGDGFYLAGAARSWPPRWRILLSGLLRCVSGILLVVVPGEMDLSLIADPGALTREEILDIADELARALEAAA